MLARIQIGKESESISDLRRLFKELNYTESALTTLLKVPCLSKLDATLLPYYLWLCRDEKDPLSLLVRVFLLRVGVAPARLSKLLGRELISTLKMCGVLGREKGQLYSKVSLYPCNGQLFITDYWVVQGPQELGHVYELGQDSYSLARLTPRLTEGNSLDLCTGSGIHAVASASKGLKSRAVDINPRALEYTAFNAVLNGAEVSGSLGDLYEPAEDHRFDLITANPPFVPSFEDEVLIHRSPGVTGEEVSERLMRGLPKYLATGGLFSMILNYPVRADDPYLDRLQGWLGETSGWMIVVVNIDEVELGAYIRAHLLVNETYQAKFESYLDSYQSQGIVSMGGANVFVRRLTSGQPNILLQVSTCPPVADVSDQVGLWLDTLVAAHSPEARMESFALNSAITKVWRGESDSEIKLDLEPGYWLPTPELTEEEAGTLSALVDGTCDGTHEGFSGLAAQGVVSCLETERKG